MLVDLHPRLYHMAADASWPSIQRHGLLSTSALLDLFEVAAELRDQLESRHRPNSFQIEHPLHGGAWIRDQKPMSDESVSRALAGTGLTPEDWYRLLNRRVFFWTGTDRLERMMAAPPYRGRYHSVLTVDTRSLVERHLGEITLSPINSGATRPFPPAPRGPDTFQPLSKFPFQHYRRLRGSSNAVVELAVHHSVPDISDHVIAVERRRVNSPTVAIWSRS